MTNKYCVGCGQTHKAKAFSTKKIKLEEQDLFNEFKKKNNYKIVNLHSDNNFICNARYMEFYRFKKEYINNCNVEKEITDYLHSIQSPLKKKKKNCSGILVLDFKIWIKENNIISKDGTKIIGKIIDNFIYSSNCTKSIILKKDVLIVLNLKKLYINRTKERKKYLKRRILILIKLFNILNL